MPEFEPRTYNLRDNGFTKWATPTLAPPNMKHPFSFVHDRVAMIMNYLLYYQNFLFANLIIYIC